MRADVDNINNHNNVTKNKMEMINQSYTTFEMRRIELVESLKNMQKSIVVLQDRKLDESSAIDSFQEVKNMIRA